MVYIYIEYKGYKTYILYSACILCNSISKNVSLCVLYYYIILYRKCLVLEVQHDTKYFTI